MTVLIAGSDLQMIRKFRDNLKNQQGIKVLDPVSSGVWALEVAKEKSPDLVLFGAITSDISGIEAAKMLKEQSPEVRVVLTSANFNKEFLYAAVSLKLDGYLPADVDKEVINSMIQQISGNDPFYFAMDF